MKLLSEAAQYALQAVVLMAQHPAEAHKVRAVAAQVRAFLGQTPVEVNRATLVPGYVGFYLVELQLPAVVNAGISDLSISAGGQDSNHVQLPLEP